jgi:hypothetical protein
MRSFYSGANSNLTSAVERVLGQKHTLLAKAMTPVNAEPSSPSEKIPAAIITRAKQIVEERRSRRVARYEEVIALHRNGMSQQGISRTLDIGRKTVRRFLRAGQFPERATPGRRPRRVNAFQETLNRRWNEGCHNATQLWREIQAKGYTGGRSMVAVLWPPFVRTAQGTFARRLPLVAEKRNLHLRGKLPCCCLVSPIN